MTRGCRKRGQVEMVLRTHGGRRPGAGRKSSGDRPGARHRARLEDDPSHPAHVTIRVVGSASGLRRKDIYLGLREATIVTARREDFRIVHMSIQRDHIHLIVEADGEKALSNGVRGFSISAARQINKAMTARGGDRRTGKVICDRFHARPLTSPRAVRNAIAYLLSAAHLAPAKLGSLSPADLGARGPRAPLNASRPALPRCSQAGARRWISRRDHCDAARHLII